MLPLCKLATKSLQFSISCNHGFLLSISVVQSRIIVLSFSNSHVLYSGFLPAPVIQMMLWLCQQFLCAFWTVFSLLFELYDFFLCGNTQLSWVDLFTQFLWMPLLITSHFSQNVISTTCTFFQTDTDTALNVRTSHPSSWAWNSQTYWMKKLLSGMPHTILPVLCPSPLHSTFTMGQTP